MRHRLTVLVVCLVALLAGAASPSRADTTGTELPFSNSGSSWLAVDPVGKHVFVSGGPGTSSIAVLDFDGKIVGTITGEPGATQMAIDSATHMLYVALHDATAISAIDTQTLAEIARFSTYPYLSPWNVAIGGGKLWFSCFGGGSGCVASMNLNGTGLADAGLGSDTVSLTTGGTNGHLLGTASAAGEPPRISVYDISSGSPSLIKTELNPSSGAGSFGFVGQMIFDEPSGANLLVAAANPSFVSSLSSTTLAPSFEYPVNVYPRAVATTADGKWVAAGADASPANPTSVYLYRAGNTTPTKTWALGGMPVPAHSLAFSPDGMRLYALANNYTTGKIDFYVLDSPILATSISLTRSASSVRYGSAATLKVHVAGTNSGKVDLYARTTSDTTKLVATHTLRSHAARFKVKPKQNTTYSAQLEQNGSHASSTSRSVKVTVGPIVTVATHREPGVVVKNGIRGIKTDLIGKVRPPRPYVVCTCGTSEPETMGFVVQHLVGRGWHTVLRISPFSIGSGGVARA